MKNFKTNLSERVCNERVKLERKSANLPMVGAVILCLFMGYSPAIAAVDMFLNAGDIHGEAQDAFHSGEIDVLAWSWGMSNSVMVIKGGVDNNKAFFQELSLTKWVDKSSPLLLRACAEGTPIPQCILTIRKAGGDTPLEYLVITMKDVVVSMISTGGSGGEDRLTETISLKYGWIGYTYTPQQQDGTAMEPIPFAWDVVENAYGL